jgi:hypothetical protein
MTVLFFFSFEINSFVIMKLMLFELSFSCAYLMLFFVGSSLKDKGNETECFTE